MCSKHKPEKKKSTEAVSSTRLQVVDSTASCVSSNKTHLPHVTDLFVQLENRITYV